MRNNNQSGKQHKIQGRKPQQQQRFSYRGNNNQNLIWQYNQQMQDPSNPEYIQQPNYDPNNQNVNYGVGNPAQQNNFGQRQQFNHNQIQPQQDQGRHFQNGQYHQGYQRYGQQNLNNGSPHQQFQQANHFQGKQKRYRPNDQQAFQTQQQYMQQQPDQNLVAGMLQQSQHVVGALDQDSPILAGIIAQQTTPPQVISVSQSISDENQQFTFNRVNESLTLSSQQTNREQETINKRKSIPYNPSYLSWTEKAQDDILVFLDLTKFKTQPCPLLITNSVAQHNPKRCFYFHDFKKDRRRQLGTYTSEMCSEITNSATHYQCLSNGESCLKAHNRVEEFYHPEKYKAKFCQTYPQDMENCEYGEMCAFAHSEDEITIDLLHKIEPKNADFYMFYFKTAWCPWSDDHDKERCVYAHNWQDLRRKPHIYNYEKELCQNWLIDNFIRSYSDGCINEYRCSYSHGWKEQQYHPKNYKINPCKQQNKCRKLHCPYFHSEEDRRYAIDSSFILLPRNRGGNFSQANPHLNLYKDIFMSFLFNDRSRTQQNGFRNSKQQTIYGCGPQSVPVIDPKVLHQFSMQQERLTIPSHDQKSASTSPMRFNPQNQQVLSPQQTQQPQMTTEQILMNMKLMQHQNLLNQLQQQTPVSQLQMQQQLQSQIQQYQQFQYKQNLQMQQQQQNFQLFGNTMMEKDNFAQSSVSSEAELVAMDKKYNLHHGKRLSVPNFTHAEDQVSQDTFGMNMNNQNHKDSSSKNPPIFQERKFKKSPFQQRQYQSQLILNNAGILADKQSQPSLKNIEKTPLNEIQEVAPIHSIFSNSSFNNRDNSPPFGKRSVPNLQMNMLSPQIQREENQSPLANPDVLVNNPPLSNRTKSIRSQFFSNKFSQNEMKKKEPSPEGQDAQLLHDKQLNPLMQSLDDLLKGDHSSNNDDVVDDQIQIIDQEDKKSPRDACYEDLDVDIVDNTDVPYKVLQDQSQSQFDLPKKQRTFSNEVTIEEIKSQLKHGKLKKSHPNPKDTKDATATVKQQPSPQLSPEQQCSFLQNLQLLQQQQHQQQQCQFTPMYKIQQPTSAPQQQQYQAPPQQTQQFQQQDNTLLPESMLQIAQEHVRKHGISSIPQLIDENEKQICEVLQQSRVLQDDQQGMKVLSPEIKRELIDFIRSSVENEEI